MGSIFHPEQRKWKLQNFSLTKERGGTIFMNKLWGGVYFSNKGRRRNISRKKEWGANKRAIFHSKHRRMEQFITNQGGMKLESYFSWTQKVGDIFTNKEAEAFFTIKEVGAICHSEQRKWELFFTPKKGSGGIFHEQRKWVLLFIPNKGSRNYFSRKMKWVLFFIPNKGIRSYSIFH